MIRNYVEAFQFFHSINLITLNTLSHFIKHLVRDSSENSIGRCLGCFTIHNFLELYVVKEIVLTVVDVCMYIHGYYMRIDEISKRCNVFVWASWDMATVNVDGYPRRR